MTNVQDLQQDVKIEVAFYVGDGQAQRCERAWQQGYETGMAGYYPQANEMYEICSHEWDSYADGYEAGKTTFMLVTASNVYSGEEDNPYPTFTTAASRYEFLSLIGGA